MHKTLITLFLCLLLNCLVGTVGRGADFTNAGIHLARGNYADAALSAVGSIPGIGDVLKGGKQAVKATSVTVGVVSQGVKHAGDAAGAGKVAAKGGQEAASGASKSVGDGGCGKFDKNGDSLCFTAGTQVIVGAEFTEDDVFVQYVTTNIEYIKVGDFVYSYDTITGVVTQKEVTAVFVRESDHINYLTIVDEYGCEQVIETTDGHPFWVVTNEPDLSRAAREVVDENGVVLYHENLEPGLNGYWVEAKDLRAGDVFIGANGELSVLVSKERAVFPDNVRVYNFTVDGNHNYFVIAQTGDYGQTCILVHNANQERYGDINNLYPSPNKTRDKVRDSQPPTMKKTHPCDRPEMRAVQKKLDIKDTIRANINSPDGHILARNVQVPIKDLYSPRLTLDIDRYLRSFEKIQKNPSTMPAIEVVEVTKSRLISLLKVF